MPESFYAEKKDKKQKKLTFYLTHKVIDRLQNYFGIAIRATCKTSVPTMSMAVGAVLFHCSEAVDSAGRHQFCPKSTTSWCKYQVDEVNSIPDSLESKNSLKISWNYNRLYLQLETANKRHFMKNL